MIRATGLVLLLAAGATASSRAADPPEFNARCGDVDCRVETQPAPWQLLGVGWICVFSRWRTKPAAAGEATRR